MQGIRIGREKRRLAIGVINFIYCVLVALFKKYAVNCDRIRITILNKNSHYGSACSVKYSKMCFLQLLLLIVSVISQCFTWNKICSNDKCLNCVVIHF